MLESSSADLDGTDLKKLCRNARTAVARHVGIGPVSVLVIPRGSFPRTSSGKPQRRRLAGRLRTDSLTILTRMDFR